MTQRALAKRARMSPNTMSKIVRGAHTLTSQLQEIADVFGVPIDDVLVTPLQMGSTFATSSSPDTPRSETHADPVTVSSAATATEVRELRAHLALLQQQLAEIVAEKEVQRRRREHLSKTRLRKPERLAAPRKPR
jgi:transcriptional regulator with XRE-family HTH domain